MAYVVTLVGVLILAAGVVLAIAPERLVGWISSMDPVARFRGAILARVALGVLFLAAAPSCRSPAVVHVVGALMLIAAAAILFAGRTRMDSVLAWFLDRPSPFLRAWSVAALGFGVLLIYAGA